MKDLKEKTIRGGLARLGAQGVNFALRILSLVVLARLLDPKDFGLVGMVTAFTGVLSLFRDFGLSSAVIQRADITEEQISTLFWINLLVGIVLAILTLAMAPVIAAFYHEPRLLAVTAVLSVGFFVNAAGVQHGALLQRELKFTAVAIINTVSLVLGTAIGIGMAIKGYGYWSLVVMTVIQPLVTTVGCWLTVSWVPGRPRRRAGIRSMMHFGGTITLNSLVVYIANNFEKILLGRFWGADALGIYGRAYQLINIPTDNLNSAAGEVAFSALSRLQNDPPRLKNYFLKGYSLILAMTLPVTIACALFASDIVLVFLGPKWREAIPIFRLLAPTILVFAIVNPLGWLLYSTGLAGRALKMGLVISPLMIGGYALGLHSGPKGVAFGYSAVMVLWVLPAIAWAVKGSAISFRDIIRIANKPMVSSVVAGSLAFAFKVFCGRLVSPWIGLTLETGILIAAFALILLFVVGEKSLYFELYRSLKRAPEANEKDFASV